MTFIDTALLTGLRKYLDVLENFDKLDYQDRERFLDDMKRDFGILFLALKEYINPRTDDCTDRGNQI